MKSVTADNYKQYFIGLNLHLTQQYLNNVCKHVFLLTWSIFLISFCQFQLLGVMLYISIKQVT